MFTKIFPSNLSNLIVSLCQISMKSNAVICKRVFYTTEIVMRYNHRQTRSVNRPSRATHSDIRSLTRIPSENIGCEKKRRKGGREGYRKLQRKRKRERQKEKKWGSCGVISVRWISGHADKTKRATVRPSNSSEFPWDWTRVSERASELCRAMVSYYVSHRWVSRSVWFCELFVAGTETACNAPRARLSA